MRKCVALPAGALVLGLSTVAAWPAGQPQGPPSEKAAAAANEAAAAQELAALCAKLVCRKASRTIALRMGDNSSFEIGTRPLPYLDDKGMLILFAGESVTLSYAADDQKFEHPLLSSVKDPVGPVELPRPVSTAAVTFSFDQMDAKPDMMLTVTNTAKAAIKYDAVMFVPDPAGGGAKGSHTSACAVLAPQGNSPSFSTFEHWPHPIVMLLISNVHALPTSSEMACN